MAKTDLAPAMGNVIQFPDRWSKRADDPNAWHSKPVAIWTTFDEICEARWHLADANETIARWEKGEEVTNEEYIVASVKIPLWEEILKEREAAAAPSTLSYGGVAYAECAGRA